MHPPFLESFMRISTIGRQQSGHMHLRGETMCSPLFFPPGDFTRAFSQSGLLHRIKSFQTATSAIHLRLHISVRAAARQAFSLPAKLSLRFCNTCAHTTGKRCGCLLTGGEPPVGQTFHRPATPHPALHRVTNRDEFCCSPTRYFNRVRRRQLCCRDTRSAVRFHRPT